MALLVIFSALLLFLQVERTGFITADRLSSLLSNGLDTEVQIESLDLDGLDKLKVRGIYIEDSNGDTLLYAEEAFFDINLKALFSRTIQFQEASLNNSYLQVQRMEGEENYNFERMFEGLVKEDTAATPWDLKFDDVHMTSTRARLNDEVLGMEMNLNADFLQTQVNELVSEDGVTVINNFFAENLRYRIIKEEETLELPQEQKESLSEPWRVRVDTLRIINSNFAFDDRTEPESGAGIDWNHLQVSGIDGKMHSIVVEEDYIAGEIASFCLQEQAGFELSDLKGKLVADLPSLNVRVDTLITPDSRVTETIALYFPDLDRFAETAEDISTRSNFSNAVISIPDVAYFWPPLDTIAILKGKKVQLDGSLEGKVQNFTASNFMAMLDHQNMFRGTLHAEGLPEVEHATLELVLDTLVLGNEILLALFEEEPEQINLQALGNIRMEGNMQGGLEDLNVRTRIYTNAGSLSPRGRISFSEKFDLTGFAGSVSAQNFHIGRTFNIEQAGRLTADVNVRGTPERISAFSGRIHNFQFNEYAYNNLLFQGSFIEDQLKARIDARDPNLNGLISLEMHTQAEPVDYVVAADFERLDLQALNLIDDPFTVEGVVSADLQGTHPDSITGNARLENVEIDRGRRQFSIDQLVINSEMEGRQRLITARSDNFNLEVDGTFRPSILPDAAQHFLSHYHSSIESPGPVHPADLDFTVHVEDDEGLISAFMPELDELDSLRIDADWIADSHVLQFQAHADAIEYAGTRAVELDIQINADREQLDFAAGSNLLDLPGQVQFQQPLVQGVLQDDILNFETEFADTTSNTVVDLIGNLTYIRDTFNLAVPDANILLRGNEWSLTEEARVVFSGDYFKIQDFILQADPDQLIAINSGEGTSDDATITGRVRNVRISEFTSLFGLDYGLRGLLSGETTISGIPGEPGVEAEFQVENLRRDTVQLGNLTAQLRKDRGEQLLNIDASLNGADPNAQITGNVGMSDPMPLNLHAEVERLDLVTIQPFVQDFAYAMSGPVVADLEIGGTVDTPVVNGRIVFPEQTMVGLQLTQTPYYFQDEQVEITSQRINFSDFNLSDPEGNQALLTGEVRHQNLQDFYVDLRLEGEDFLFMDNPDAEDLPIYGTIYADINATVQGPVSDLDVDFRVESSEGSVVVISVVPPVGEYNPPTYIQFVTPDSLLEEEEQQAQYNFDMGSVHMEGVVVATQDAQIEIIVDPANGDRIIGRGTGEFQVELDADGNLSLAGTYQLVEGSYTFTFLNIIKRSFQIVEGSTVSWYGDPEEGQMDVTAKYNTEASRYPLVKDQMESLPAGELRAARRELPVTVYLFLQGDIEQPDLSFDIEIPEGSDAFSTSMVSQRLNEIENTPSELNKQVMGLIAFNQFFPYQGFEIGGGGGGAGAVAAESVTQFLNKQLGVVTDQLGGIEFDVSVKPGDQLDLEALNVAASKDISDRLTVSIGGDVPLGERGDQYGGFLGDYMIYYRLNETGTIKLKVFSRTQQDIYTDYIQQISGFSLHHHKNTDDLKDVIIRW